MRRALVISSLAATAFGAALAAPASAQVYDRYGGSADHNMPAYAQGPSRVLTWNGKQTQPVPQMAQPQPYPAQAYPQPYPQQAYPQQAYGQPQPMAYPPQAYPQPQQAYPQQGYGYSQQGQGYYPSIQGRYGQPPLGTKRQQQQQEQAAQQMPPYREGPQQGMPSYEDMQRQKARQQAMQQSMQPPQPFPIMNTPPQGAWAYQQGYPQQPYPQQAYPQAAPVAYPQPQQQPYPAQAYPQQAQQQAMPAPAEPAVTAAPTTPVQSQPLPTSIYAPAPPRAELAPPMPAGLPADVQSQPSGGGAGATALASLDYRGLSANDPRNPGVRHYSVHRPFGMSPDPAPIPPVDNQVIITQPQDAELDTADTGLRGVGMDPPEKSKKSDD